MPILRRLVALATIVGLGACGAGGDAPKAFETVANQVTQRRPGSGLALRAAVSRDTVPSSDHRPVDVVFALVNGPTPVHLNANPQRFELYVVGPDGHPARSLDGSGPPLSPEHSTYMQLPADSALVFRQDLRCISIDGTYHPITERPTANDCLGMFALSEPGRYSIVVRYYPELSFRELDSLSKVVATPAHIRPDHASPIGRYLADTVHLYVVSDQS